MCTYSSATQSSSSAESPFADSPRFPTSAWVNCPVWVNRTNTFYKSAAFLAVESENQDFLDSLKPIVGNRSTALANMYNIFDFLNVQSIHNATFADLVNATGEGTLSKARDLAK